MGSAGKRHQRHAMTCGEAFRRSEPYIIGVVGKMATRSSSAWSWSSRASRIAWTALPGLSSCYSLQPTCYSFDDGNPECRRAALQPTASAPVSRRPSHTTKKEPKKVATELLQFRGKKGRKMG